MNTTGPCSCTLGGGCYCEKNSGAVRDIPAGHVVHSDLPKAIGHREWGLCGIHIEQVRNIVFDIRNNIMVERRVKVTV